MRSPSTSVGQVPSALPVGGYHAPEGRDSNGEAKAGRGGGTSSQRDLYSPQQTKIACGGMEADGRSRFLNQRLGQANFHYPRLVRQL